MYCRARAHSNIALVKYWGKRDIGLNLPAVASISITLEALYTETSVKMDNSVQADELVLNGEKAGTKETGRVSRFLDIIRGAGGINSPARVESENNFPTSAGLASSASSFACLALAASRAAGLDLSPRELSELARKGSGSAARSLFGGFVEMRLGDAQDGSDAYAYQLYPAEFWDLRVMIAITSEKKKKTGSTDGMELSRNTSPYYGRWIDSSINDMNEMREAIAKRDFEMVADISEFSCLKMHALAMASRPGLIYWNGTTVDLIHSIRDLRAAGTNVFFTIDAGPQVKAICTADDAAKVRRMLEETPGVQRVIETGLGGDARVLQEETV